MTDENAAIVFDETDFVVPERPSADRLAAACEALARLLPAPMLAELPPEVVQTLTQLVAYANEITLPPDWPALPEGNDS